MKNSILLFLIFGSQLLVGQNQFKGTIVDAQTGQPIPYVNIGIVEKGIGTVSDEEGLFYLNLDKNEIDPKSSILFSSLGYALVKVKVDEIPSIDNEYPIFEMIPEPVVLNEVVVSNKGNRFVTDMVGYKNYGEESFGYWKDQIALGGELATRVVAKSGLRRLNRFQFEVFQNPSDSLMLRVNIYEDDGIEGRPKTNLNKSDKNILVTIESTDKIVEIDLKPYDIYVKNDFIVSLELLKVYGKEELGLILAAAFNKYGSYRRYASQSKWESISDQNMAYLLETELMVSDKVAQRFEKRQTKKNKKKRTISGFTLRKGKMIAGVEVVNKRTKEIVYTDEKGRYIIVAEKNDEILFKKKGFRNRILSVGDKPTANITMKEE